MMDDRKRRFYVIGIIVILLLGSVLGTFVADLRAKKGAEQRAESILLDSAREQAATFASTLEGRLRVLKSVSASLALSGKTEPEAIDRYLEEVSQSAGLKLSSLDLINPDGYKAAVEDEAAVNVADREYFLSAMAGEDAIQSVIGKRTRRKCIMLAVPYYKDGEVAGVLRGLYYEEDMRALLDSQVYGGGGYSYLISSGGRIIVNAESDENLTNKNSVFDALATAEFQKGDSLEKLKNDLLTGASDTIHYVYNSRSRVAVLVPLSGILPQNDWYVFNIVDEDSLLPEIRTSRRDSIESMAVFAGFAVVSLALFMLLENDYRRKKQKENEMTRQREEQFRIVTEQSGKFVMRYDIPSKTAHRSDAGSDGFGGGESCADFVEGTISKGRIDSSSVDDYRDFFRRIDEGESPVSNDFLMITPEGERRWIKHVSTTIFDSKNRPSTAIISYFDNTEQRERELAYSKWQQELDGIPYESAALYEWNLTKDLCDGQRGSLVLPFDLERDSFNERSEYLADGHVFEDDRAAFLAMMNREHLMAMYFSKVYQCSLDYRHIDGGEIRWRRISLQLVPYPDGEDIKAYVTVRDIDDEKRGELELIARSQLDYLTGAYNRETFINRVSELIARAPASTSALLMLDVDGFKRVNDQLGHDAGDRVLKDIVGCIRTVLRSSDIIGRVGGDEFMVFLPDMPFDAAISRKAAQLCASMRHRINDRLSVSVSVGIAVYPRDGADFSELYKCSDAALYRAKSLGKDGYAFYHKELPEAALSEHGTLALSTVPERHIVLVATDCAEVSSTIANALKTEYDPISIDKDTDLNALLGARNAVYACIIDADSPVGVEVLNLLGDIIMSHGITIYAVAHDRSDETYIDLLHKGVTLAFSKPINKDLLLLRLDMLYSSRDIQKTHFQSEYRRLQTTEERRYREVLSATGTTVFIYDVATRTYQVDLLAQRYTSGSFEGRELGADMVKKGILSSDDVELIKSSMDSVAAGGADMLSHTVLLTTKTGEKRWFNIQIMKLENADVLSPKLLITANDINETVKAENALRLRAETDALTGLYNRESFIEKASRLIAERESGYYIMACFDIDNFKVFNDQYGSDKGDEALKYIADVFRLGFGAVGGICCRVMADNFAVLYPRSFVDSPEIAEIRQTAARLDGSTEPITFSIGRYLVTDKSLSVSAMFDRASIAESSVKGRFDANIAQYDESMREHILREQEIISEMKTALEKENFEVWLQPQYNHSTGAIIGAEALVRWRHPKRGLIPPAEFIPVFERNGFIYEMDKLVWERSCALLRGWIADGRAPLALSVNVSRYDIFRDDFFEVITGLVERYEIPVNMLRLEITESAFARSTEQIITVVRRLIDYGFIIEIDDFGSGYSSLNTLKDVPASVLKLDMRFLENNENSSRGGNILESVVRMSRWLGMSVIAEGVETIEQADYLRSVGCSYVQGYLYAKPMTVEEYELLAAASGKENRLITLETVASLDNDAFWDPKSMETLIFNSYVGGACIFEYLGGKTELLRVNEKYAEALGSDGMSIEQALSLNLSEHMDEENLAVMAANIRRAIETREESTCEVRLFGLPGKREYTYFRVTARLLAQTGERRLLYAGVIDVSAQREAEHKERETAEQMKAIMKNMNGGVTAVTISDAGAINYIFANDKYYSILGYTREQFEKEVDDAFDIVFPEDRERIKKTVASVIADRALAVYEYRCIKRGGQIVNLRCNASMTTMEGISDDVLLSVTTDITELTRAERRAVETSERLEAIMSNVNGGITAVTIIDSLPHFLFANDMYFEQLGYTREQFEAEVGNAFELVHPDDREEVARVTKSASETREPFSCTYRARRRDGSLVWLQSNISICDFDGVPAPVQLAVANDITAAKEADRAVLETSKQLVFLNETAHDLFVQTDVDYGVELVLRKVLDYFRGERAYIIELDRARDVSDNTYEVCA